MPGPCTTLGGLSLDRAGVAGGGSLDLGGRGVVERDFAPPPDAVLMTEPVGDPGRRLEAVDELVVDLESADDVDSWEDVYPIRGAVTDGIGAMDVVGEGGGSSGMMTFRADGSRTSISSRRNWKSRPNSCKSL